MDLALPHTTDGGDFAGADNDFESLERPPTPPLTRSEALKAAIPALEVEIMSAKTLLQEDLRLSRHLSILTPFGRPTTERLIYSAAPIAKRISAARIQIVKAVCYREVLVRDLALETRSPVPRRASGHGHSRSKSSSSKPSHLLRRGKYEAESDDSDDNSFQSAREERDETVHIS